MAIDQNTGLAELPEGYRWRIKRSLFMGRRWVKVKLQKSTPLGWHTVRTDETKPEYFSWSLEDQKKAWFERKEIKAARKAKLRAARRAKYGKSIFERLADDHKDWNQNKYLFGSYPPKKYEGTR